MHDGHHDALDGADGIRPQPAPRLRLPGARLDAPARARIPRARALHARAVTTASRGDVRAALAPQRQDEDGRLRGARRHLRTDEPVRCGGGGGRRAAPARRTGTR